MMQPFRLAHGGAIDRDRPLAFTFNGRALEGYAGDTVASALLASGVRIVSRSLKYHRPRGIYSAVAEEPNALVRIGEGARVIPNQTATGAELYAGMRVTSINCWPSVELDFGCVNDFCSALLPAGFYYKTFMWPGAAWMWYETLIRRAAGLARTPQSPDADRYDKRNALVDVLVIGGGSAGLAAALAAGRAGARVMICERDARLGGQLAWRGGEVFGHASDPVRRQSAAEWLAATTRVLGGLQNVQILTRTTAFGYYDHNLVTLVERVTDHLASPPAGPPRERLWKVRAKQVVVTTGAFERLLVFPGNDLPGVMLASAAHRYLSQFAVRPGARIVLFTNNDSAYTVAAALHEAGTAVAAIVDVRPDSAASTAARGVGMRVETQAVVAAAEGTRRVTGVRVARLLEGQLRNGASSAYACDALLLAGGWDPAVHLYSQSGSKLAFEPVQRCFVPAQAVQAVSAAGAANGVFLADDCIADGAATGCAAALGAGFSSAGSIRRPTRNLLSVAAISEVPVRGRRKAFVDLQSDVVAADIRLAAQEGFAAVEHAKRYTTTGMGIDQGKIGNIAALSILGDATAKSVGQVGTSTFRPPFVPVTIGALAGREIGPLFDPLRETPIGDWHDHAGAVMEPVGLWRRPRYYPRSGEEASVAIARECSIVREHVGMLDASTLGKIELKGRDVLELLNRVYTNAWDSLPIGQCRYGLMLRESGMVFDDGVCARLGEHHYLMSTTSGGARDVEHWLEEWLQCEWRDLKVFVTPVTAQWATIAVAGPRARDVLMCCESEINFSPSAFPHLAARLGHFAGVTARIFRVSFTGELSYEINVPARFGRALWECLMQCGRPYGIGPIGLEAIDVLRTEKGFIAVGHETDGSVTPADLGMDWIVSRKKGDFIGRRGLACSDTAREGRKQLVGLLTTDAGIVLRVGSQLIAWADRRQIRRPPVSMIGHVTSSGASPNLGRSIALALVENGRARIGERIAAVDRGRIVEVTIAAPRFFDLDGERLHA